jgi:predicted metal-dependent hydrolase
VKAFLSGRTDWLLEHATALHVFEEDQLIGKSIRVMLRKISDNSPTQVRLKDKRHIVVSSSTASSLEESLVQSKVKMLAKKALKIEAEQLVTQRLDELATQYGLPYSVVSYKQLKRRWGSCNSKKELVFNAQLTTLAWPEIDYVITHELAHTRHLNHGADFWLLLEELLPGAKTVSKYVAKKHAPFA